MGDDLDASLRGTVKRTIMNYIDILSTHEIECPSRHLFTIHEMDVTTPLLIIDTHVFHFQFNTVVQCISPLLIVL
jgi:hypothetical protein